MSDQSLYDRDILLWSEQQAEVIRRLGRTRRDLSNELDVENVAEEIESVGRSELAAVKSHIRLILLHLLKVILEANSEAARHWRGEIVTFHSDLADRYAPSMRQRIDMDALWRSAREQLRIAHDGDPESPLDGLPSRCPVDLDDLLGEQIDILRLERRLRERAVETSPDR